MSKSSLKNKVDSIRRTLKNQGLEVASPIIESKIFELCPNFESDWSDDVRAEVIKAIRKKLQSEESAIISTEADAYPPTVEEMEADSQALVIEAVEEIQQPAIEELETEIQPPDIQEIDPDLVAQPQKPVNALTLTHEDKREMTLQKSRELGFTLSNEEINLVADSIEICGESLDELLSELESTLTAYIDYKAKENTQKIDTALDNVVDYAEQRFGENSQHLARRLHSLGGKLESVSEQHKSSVKTLLSRFTVPNH